MAKVKIITDSCANLSAEEAKALGVTVIPLTIQIGDEKFEDGDTDITNYFFEQQERGTMPVSVYAPEVAKFEKVYSALRKETDQIVAIHVSKHLIGVWENSRTGAEMFKGRSNIEVVDSNTILLGQAILVRKAAEAALAGAGVDEIVRLVRGLIPHIYTVFFVDTMSHLEKSGIVGKAQAMLGTMMQIKPLLFMEEGEIIPMEKVKTVNKAIDKLTEFVAEFDDIEQAVILQRHLEPTTESSMLLDRLSQLFPDIEFPIVTYNPLVASYVGHAAMGIIIYEGDAAF